MLSGFLFVARTRQSHDHAHRLRRHIRPTVDHLTVAHHIPQGAFSPFPNC